MTSLSEHERYLDELDEKMFLRKGEIFCCFDKPFSVDPDTCRGADALVNTAREVALRLIQQDSLDVGYLAKRFMRLADLALQRGFDIDRLYENHEMTILHDITLKKNELSDSEPYLLRFENGKGPYAGVHYLELQRTLDRLGGEPVGLLKISRNMVGYSKHDQHTFVAAADLVCSPTLLVFSLPPESSWQFSYACSDTKNRHLNATRIALRHEFSVAQLDEIKQRLSRIFTGLEFTCANFDDLVWPSFRELESRD